MRRLVEVVISQPNINCLKNVYFTCAKLFAEQREKTPSSEPPCQEYTH
jgi:hypothetical protein